MLSTWLTYLGLKQAESVAGPTPYAFSTLSIVAASILLVSWVSIKRIKSRRAKKLFETSHGCGAPHKIVGSWPLALDLILEAFRIMGEKQTLQWFVGWFERIGPTFAVHALGSKSIDTVEPDNIETILSTKFSVYGLGQRHRNFGMLLGDGIFTQDGAEWRHSREILRPLFSLNRTDILTQIGEHTEQLAKCIPPNEFIDLQPLFFQFTFDTTTFLLFGKSMHSLQSTSTQDGSSARVTEFTEAFRVAQDLLFRRERLGDLYWLYGSRTYRKYCAIVHRFIDEAVNEALLENPQDGKARDTHCFLNALIQETRDRKVLRNQLLNIMLAGRDTTACALTWTFRLLAQHPHVLAKLREEVNSIVGVGEESRLPDRNALKKMKYLNLVIKEVLRLYPPVPINSRVALEDTTLPKGGGVDGTQPIMVSKGEAVAYTVYVMHRLKQLYGEDADCFRPERWDPDVDNPVNLKGIGWGYLPFNGGPRICLGQEFALLEVGYVVVRMLQKFRSFELHPRDRDVAVGTEKQEVTLVLASYDGCRVKMVE